MTQQKNLPFGGEVVELDKILERSWVERLIAASETRLREEQRDAENRHNSTCLRIERKLDDSVERLEVRIDRLDEKIDKLDRKFEAKFEKLEEKLEKIDGKFEKIDGKFEKIDEKFIKVDEKFERVFDRFDAIIRWSVGIMVALVVGFSGVIATLAIML